MNENVNLVKNPTLNESMHAIVLLVNYSSYDDQEYFKNVDKFINAANNRGIPFIILVSKCDLCSKDIEEDPLKIYTSPEILEVRTQISKRTGVNIGDILPFKSYSQESFPNEKIDHIALRTLSKITSLCNSYYDKLYDGNAKHPQIEMLISQSTCRN